MAQLVQRQTDVAPVALQPGAVADHGSQRRQGRYVGCRLRLHDPRQRGYLQRPRPLPPLHQEHQFLDPMRLGFIVRRVAGDVGGAQGVELTAVLVAAGSAWRRPSYDGWRSGRKGHHSGLRGWQILVRQAYRQSPHSDGPISVSLGPLEISIKLDLFESGDCLSGLTSDQQPSCTLIVHAKAICW